MAGQSLKVTLNLLLEIINLLKEGLSSSGEWTEDIPQKKMHVSGLYSRQFGTKRALSKNFSFTLMETFQKGLNIFYQGQQLCFKAYPSMLNEKWHSSKSQSERSRQISEDNLAMNKLQSIRKIVLSIHVFSEKPNVYLLLRKRSGTEAPF